MKEHKYCKALRYVPEGRSKKADQLLPAWYRPVLQAWRGESIDPMGCADGRLEYVIISKVCCGHESHNYTGAAWYAHQINSNQHCKLNTRFLGISISTSSMAIVSSFKTGVKETKSTSLVRPLSFLLPQTRTVITHCSFLGFSRGAYTARCVAGMVQKVLLHSHRAFNALESD